MLNTNVLLYVTLQINALKTFYYTEDIIFRLFLNKTIDHL